LSKRFGPKYTPATAVLAAATLSQGHHESVADFMDRVVLSVDKMMYNVPDAAKTEDAYKLVLTAATISHFGAGLKPEIAKVVLGNPDTPNTIATMLAAAEIVEADLAKKTSAGAAVLAVAHESQSSPDDSEQDVTSLMTQLDAITAQVAAVQRRFGRSSGSSGRTGLACWNCGRVGHLRNECRQPIRDSPTKTRNPVARVTKREGKSSFKKSSKPQYLVQFEEEEEEEEDDDALSSGNEEGN